LSQTSITRPPINLRAAPVETLDHASVILGILVIFRQGRLRFGNNGTFITFKPLCRIVETESHGCS
jgi:hypothetical protein